MSPVTSKYLIWAVIISAFIGFADAAYLTAVHYLQQVPVCSLLRGCEVVTTSMYSKILGVPVALLGSLYYLVVLSLSVYVFQKGHRRAVELLSDLTWCGLIASAYFLFLQLFVIGVLCFYCVVSIVTSTIIWILCRKRFLSRYE